MYRCVHVLILVMQWVCYQSNPGQTHWKVAKRILRYLRGIIDSKLCYLGSDLQFVGYSYADWDGDLDQ